MAPEKKGRQIPSAREILQDPNITREQKLRYLQQLKNPSQPLPHSNRRHYQEADGTEGERLIHHFASLTTEPLPEFSPIRQEIVLEEKELARKKRLDELKKEILDAKVEASPIQLISGFLNYVEDQYGENGLQAANKEIEKRGVSSKKSEKEVDYALLAALAKHPKSRDVVADFLDSDINPENMHQRVDELSEYIHKKTHKESYQTPISERTIEGDFTETVTKGPLARLGDWVGNIFRRKQEEESEDEGVYEDYFDPEEYDNEEDE